MSTWFWTKFTLLIIFIAAVFAFMLPASFRGFFPEPINAFIDRYPAVLGIDLAGGTKLEYRVDFSSAIEKAKLAGKTEDEMVNKEQIANGVAKTLKKRIDPDGTREVSVFASQRGEEWFVIIELTKDVDNAENRAKLEKVTSLSFKEPYENEAEALASAQIILDGLIKKKTSYQDAFQNLSSGGEAVAVSPELIATALGEANMKLIVPHRDGWFPKVLENNQKQYFLFRLANQDFVLQYNGRWKETLLGGAQFTVAKVGTDPNTNYPVTSIEFTLEGAALFGQITEKLASRKTLQCGGQGDVFAIFVDGKMVSAPCVREKISGNAQISFGSVQGSSFASVQAEAQQLTEDLNSGATPAPVTLVAEQTISASLGDAALQLALKAFVIGFLILSVWMIWAYRFFGLLAVVALVFYTVALIAIFRMTGFVITLPGIAGMVLSVGMAVDANILIFERAREEFAQGKSFTEAIVDGFDRAWTSIRDSNTSSLLTCFILWAVGTSIIKAFAITLAVGIVLSVFTAITVTWYFIWGMTPEKWKKNPPSLLP